MRHRSLLPAIFVAGLSSHAFAQQGVRSMLVDERGNPITASNPLAVTGSGGGGGGGTVTQGTSPWVVSGNSTANGSGNPIFVQLTNPGSTGSVTAAGTNGTLAQAVQGINGGVPLSIQGGNATAVKTDGSAVTQPVSGIVTANLGTLAGAATAANQNVTAAGTSAANAQAVQGVTGGIPQNIAAASLPLPTGAATASNQTTELATLATIAKRADPYTEANGTSVPASQIFYGAIRDIGSPAAYSRFNTSVLANQAGTLTISACLDVSCSGAVTIVSVAVTANTAASLSAPVVTRYVRALYTNGSGSTAASINLLSSLTAN